MSPCISGGGSPTRSRRASNPLERPTHLMIPIREDERVGVQRGRRNPRLPNAATLARSATCGVTRGSIGARLRRRIIKIVIAKS